MQTNAAGSSRCPGASARKYIVKELFMSVSRRFAYVFVVCMCPCGVVIHGKTLPDAESPPRFLISCWRLNVEAAMKYYALSDNNWRSMQSCALPLYNGKPEGKLSLLKRAQFFVPSIHQRTHKGTDIFCQTHWKTSNLKHSDCQRGAPCERYHLGTAFCRA